MTTKRNDGFTKQKTIKWPLAHTWRGIWITIQKRSNSSFEKSVLWRFFIFFLWLVMCCIDAAVLYRIIFSSLFVAAFIFIRRCFSHFLCVCVCFCRTYFFFFVFSIIILSLSFLFCILFAHVLYSESFLFFRQKPTTIYEAATANPNLYVYGVMKAICQKSNQSAL